MTPPRMTGPDWLLLLILSLVWGGSFFFVEVILVHVPPLTLVAVRVSLAALVLACVLVVLGLPFPRGRVWGALAVMGLLNNALPFTLITLAQGQISGALASVLNATTPLFTLIVAHRFTRDERLSGGKVLGLGLGFAGVLVMMGGAALSGAAATVIAQGFSLLAALSYAFAGVWGRRFRGLGLPPLATAFGMLACASLMLVPLALVHDRSFALPFPGWAPILALVALAVLSTAFAYLIYFRLLARVGAVNLALVTFLVPVSAIALGGLLLGEALLARHWAGMALIAAGLLAIDGRFSRKA